MACNCGKNKKTGAPTPLREIGEGSSRRRISTVRRPFNRLVYYVTGPDGTETGPFVTLAEAQQTVRNLGSGHTIRSERPT